jgi:hypothetical protein
MSPTSEAQLTANRANAAQSTGPKTPEGKRRSSLNALRHGLTGRVVVLPTEDLAAYKAFSQELFASLTPETPVERQFAQTYIDTQWRLNRIRSIEDGMFALGHFEQAANIDVDHPEIHSALTAARKFREDSQAFVNLSLYEQRLHRTLKESLRQLQELQANRIAACQAELDAAETARNLNKTQNKPSEPGIDSARPQASAVTPIGFVFSTRQVEHEAPHKNRLADARYAQSLGYNVDDYLSHTLKPAA